LITLYFGHFMPAPWFFGDKMVTSVTWGDTGECAYFRG
jgi:hypothetical protein